MGNRLCKSSMDRKICGVCGGIAEYLHTDSTLIRLIWALVTLFTVGTGVVAYVIAALIMPEESY